MPSGTYRRRPLPIVIGNTHKAPPPKGARGFGVWTMFRAIESPVARGWLLGLLVLWAGLLVGGWLFGQAQKPDNRRIPAWTRMGSSLALVVAGWSLAWLARHSAAATFSVLIAAGMTLGFLGDLFMAQWLPLKEPVLGGIGAFGLGHITYIVAMLLLANRPGTGLRWAAWGVWLLIGLAGWFVIVYPGTRPAALRWAALPYTLLLASTAGVATGLALHSSAFLRLAIGAGLFFVSDLILATELFTAFRFPAMGDAVWLTYGPGQMLMVYSVASALAVAKTA